MKTNRKIRPQPSLASLTTDEYHQLADMVCTRTYEDVRQQINKPRSQGGFDLNISVKPLQVLHARVQRLNKINAKLATAEKLTLTAYDEIHAGEHRAPEEVHNAIMDATYVLVTEHDNTPHQLLALQRLADFPERAAIRSAKEERAEESHAWKREMLDHKKEMDQHRKKMDEEKLKLSREKSEATRAASNSKLKTQNSSLEQSDHLGPYAADLEGIRERARKHFGITAEESARRAELRRKFNSGELKLPQHCGMLDAPTAPSSNGGTNWARSAELLPVLASSPTSISRDATTPTDAAPAHPNATDVATSASDPKSEISNQKSEIDEAPASETQNSELTTQNSTSAEAVAEAVERYTVTRAREHVAYQQKHTPWPYLQSPPQYITEFRHCPCGNPCPCPTHESEEFGPYPEIFWKLSPFSPDYAACLRHRNLPYRLPQEYLA